MPHYYTEDNVHPTTPNMRRFLPAELHGVLWCDIVDPTTLSLGDWVFNPAPSAHYAGRIENIFLDSGVVEIRWLKTEYDHFNSYESPNNLQQLWWVDPTFDGLE